MHLVTKEMRIVEKLQMTSNKGVVLPLGCVWTLDARVTLLGPPRTAMVHPK